MNEVRPTTVPSPTEGAAHPAASGANGRCRVSECIHGITYESVKPFTNTVKAQEAVARLTVACAAGFTSLFNAQAAAQAATGTRWKCSRPAAT